MERDDSKPATAKEAPWRAPISLEEPLFCVWIHGHNISLAFAKAIIARLPLLCKRVFPVTPVTAKAIPLPPLPHIGAAHQIVQADVEEISDGDKAAEVGKPSSIFISLIGIERQTKLFRHFPLF